MDKKEILSLFPENMTSRVFIHDFEGDRMGEVYAPFLSIIMALMKETGVSVAELMEQTNVYELHKTTFESYFCTGRCRRQEDVIYSEVEFEREKMKKTIANMLVKLCNGRDIYLILNDVNYSGASALALLDYIMGEEKCQNIKIIAFDNENAKIKSHDKEPRARFVSHCHERSCAFEWFVNEEEEECGTENIKENDFIFQGVDMDEYLRQTYNMYCFFAYDEMRYYLSIIYQKVQIENLGLNIDQQARLYLQLITLSMMQGDCSYALLVAENLQKLSEMTENWQLVYAYHQRMAYIHMYSGNEKEAEEASQKCIQIAREKADEYLEFKGHLAKCMSRCKGFYNIMMNPGMDGVEDLLLEQCKKYHYYNHLAHIYVYCFEATSIQEKTIESMEGELSYFKRGIEIGEKLENDQFLMEAYRFIIMIASINGMRELVTYFYEKNILAAQRSGNIFEEAMVYNGFGYNYCTGEEYAVAHHYFSQALQIFHQLGLDDYIIETFYNMALNALMAEEYTNATLYLEKTMYLLGLNKKNSLRVCNISKVIGLLAMSNFYQGKIYNARNYLMKDGQFLDHIIEFDKDNKKNYLWDDDMFLYCICQALLCNYDGKYKEAMEWYQESQLYMERSQGSYFFAYPHYVMAKQHTLLKLGKKEERMELLKEYKEFCYEHDYIRHLQSVNTLLNTEEDSLTNYGSYEKNSLSCLIIDEVCEAARIRSVENEAKERREDIQFFSLFQNLLDKNEDSIRKRVENVLSVFASNYGLDGIISIHILDGENVVYKEKAKYVTEESIKLLIRFFEEKRTGFAVSKFNGNYKDYRKLFSTMFGEKVFSIVGVPIFENEELVAIFVAYTKSRDSWNVSTDRYVLNDYDLEIYTFLFRQIINAIKKWQTNEEIERMNRLLQKQAITDELTGLYNVQGYYSLIRSILSDEAARKKKYAFVFMDLDHFKHYNDSFGHHVGDALLKKFTEIFQKRALPETKLIRIGGDEFVMILDYENRESVVQMAKDILKEIQNAAGFVDVIKAYSKKGHHIEEEHYAGCSIGIAYMDHGITSEEDFEEARKNADAALYNVKEHGRNGYKEWNESL